MGRAAKKPNFLFSEEDEIPGELLVAGKPRPADPEPEEPSDPPAPTPTEPTTPQPQAHTQLASGDPEDEPEEDPDEPEPDEDEEDEDAPSEDDEAADEGDEFGEGDAGVPTTPAASDQAAGKTAHPIPSGPIHYEARITIVDAWQYPGSLKNAPDWVDRNWAAFGEFDPLRNIEPGPALRVPLPSGVNAMVRVGDYLARQEVRLTRDIADIRLEVWDQDQFEKLFFPVPVPELPIAA